MANELELVSDNAAADGWVDSSPGAISTGYQSQNTAIQALFNGFDNSAISLNGLNADLAISGIIDDSGLPFVIKTAFSLVLPTTGDNHFLKVTAGASAIERNIVFTTSRGTFDASKNAFYSGTGERVLNWIFNVPSGELLKISGSKATADLKLGSAIQTNTGAAQYLAVVATWYKYANWTGVSDKLTEFSGNTYTAKESGKKRIFASINFNITTTTAVVYGVAIYVNGALYLANRRQHTSSAIYPDYIESVSCEIDLAIGDTVEIYVLGQNGGAGTNPVTGKFFSVNQNKDLF